MASADADIPDDVRREIEKRLADIERKFSVEVFYACESGSRAWDFASKDSDYDVRFLYVHPRNWYLSLSEQRDVIETPLDGVYDINGWDLRKALRLAAKGNPVLFEWLSSPIHYFERPLAERFREAAFECFDSAKAYHHYLSMARGQARAYLKWETVRHKKYFYAVRPLLACLFLLERHEPVPMRFADLANIVPLPPSVRAAMDELLDAKRKGTEAASAARIPALDGWIEETVALLISKAPEGTAEQDIDRLDRFFLSVIVP